MAELKGNRGGARKGAGRKAEDGAVGLVTYTVKLTPTQKTFCQESGPALVRQIIEAAMKASQG